MNTSAERRFLRLLARPGTSTTIVLVALFVLFSILSPHFLTGGNIKNILTQSMFVLLIATGMSFVLLTGAIDLSVGSVAGLSAGVTIWVGINGAGFVLAVLGGVAVGLLVGLVNALIILKFRISDFIVTLGTLSITEGALTLLVSSRSLQGFSSPAFVALANNNIVGIPAPIVIGALFVVGLQFILGRTLFGRLVFATGINASASRLAGINVDRVRLAVFLISGLMASVAGVIMASQLTSVQSGLGQDLTLQAIAAAVVGGTSLAGGSGSVLRAVVGALFLGELSNGLQLLQVNSSWYTVFVGLSLVGAMALDEGTRTLVLRHLGRTPADPGPPLHGRVVAERPLTTTKEVS
jgi:ribose/xylose/arabinose/galactoside ABC-type transport system permease subunit